jgi:hypothetical protein
VSRKAFLDWDSPKKLTIIMVGLEIVKFLSLSNDSKLYWSNAQIIFPASQRVSISMLIIKDA